VIEALDTNHDGIIEADEIANAAASLKKLDKQGTGQLTIPELLGPPRGPRQGGPGGDQDGPPGPPPDDGGPGGQAGQSGTNGQNGPPPPPPPQ
jgi:hypothetical protein